MKRTAIAAVVAVLAAPLLWLGGEQHRSNCIAQGRAGCSVLPWQTGQTPDPLRGLSPRERRAVQRELDVQARR